MKTWQTLLRDADPAADARLTVDDVDAMRRVVLAAAREPRVEGWAWQRPLAMAMALVMMIALDSSRGYWRTASPSMERHPTARMIRLITIASTGFLMNRSVKDFTGGSGKREQGAGNREPR